MRPPGAAPRGGRPQIAGMAIGRPQSAAGAAHARCGRSTRPRVTRRARAAGRGACAARSRGIAMSASAARAARAAPLRRPRSSRSRPPSRWRRTKGRACRTRRRSRSRWTSPPSYSLHPLPPPPSTPRHAGHGAHRGAALAASSGRPPQPAPPLRHRHQQQRRQQPPSGAVSAAGCLAPALTLLCDPRDQARPFDRHPRQHLRRPHLALPRRRALAPAAERTLSAPTVPLGAAAAARRPAAYAAWPSLTLERRSCHARWRWWACAAAARERRTRSDAAVDSTAQHRRRPAAPPAAPKANCGARDRRPRGGGSQGAEAAERAHPKRGRALVARRVRRVAPPAQRGDAAVAPEQPVACHQDARRHCSDCVQLAPPPHREPLAPPALPPAEGVEEFREARGAPVAPARARAAACRARR